MSEIPSICVVTQPIGDSDKPATKDLLAILEAITAVSLVTADLPDDSVIWDRHEVVEISDQGMGDNPLVAAIRFLRNQILMCLAIRRRDEEIVLFYGAMAYILPIAFARVIGKTVIVEPRADVPLSLKLQWEQQVPGPVAAGLALIVRVLERTGYRLSHAIIAYSPGMADQLNLGTYEEKLNTNGARFVDTDTFDVQIPFEERENRVGYIGRFEEEKGIRILADVAKRLPEDVTFRFVGDGSLRGWLEAELEAQLEDGSVEIRGWVDHDEVPLELNELRLLVMPSEPTEGLPTMILESMACGTPVYATPVSGVPDVVNEGETGKLLTDPAVPAIVNDIEELRTDDELSTMSDRCCQEIKRDFTLDGAVERYRSIFEQVRRSHS